MSTPVRIGIIGMGGFAGSHHQAIARLEERGQAKLVCTCDPNAAAFVAEQHGWRLEARGVEVFTDYRRMLDACAGGLDLVVVPTPIQLHAEMHAAAAAHGLPSYLEKPPTLDHAELERMIATDRRLPRASLVGFNFIIEQGRLALKRRLLAGEFGALRGATLRALWPRPAGYFARNPWAGRLRLDGRMVLDSCFGNAMAHFVHNVLFWAGRPDVFSWAGIAAVRAEVYRGHWIEGADTFFVEADTAGGITMRFAVSHACAGNSSHCEIVVCEHATLRYSIGHQVEIRWNDGRVERTPLEPFDPLLENHQEYFRYLRGEAPRPATTLADCRPLVALNDLAYVSSATITNLPESLISRVRDEKDQKEYLHVDGMLAAQEAFLSRGAWPGASGWRPRPPEMVTPADLGRFESTIHALAAPAEPAGSGAA